MHVTLFQTLFQIYTNNEEINNFKHCKCRRRPKNKDVSGPRREEVLV